MRRQNFEKSAVSLREKMYKSLIILLATAMFFLFGAGCGKTANGTKPANNGKVKIRKVYFQTEKFDKFKLPKNDKRYYEIGSLSVFGNTAVFSSGSGEMTKENAPCLSLENYLTVYDIEKGEVNSVLKADKGFYQICNTAVNSDWIVFEEIKNIVGVPGRVYAINRKTSEKKLVYSVGNKSSPIKETFVNPPFPHQIILHKNCIYIPLTKGNESKIVKVDLHSLKAETVFYRKGGGCIFSVSSNDRYIAIDYAENGKSEILLYDFGTGLTKKLIETDIFPVELQETQFPLITDDNCIVLEKCTNLNCKKNEIIVFPVNNPDKIKTYNLNMINLCSSGNYIAGTGFQDVYVINRKANVITDIENLNGNYLCMEKDTLFVILPRIGGVEVIYANVAKEGF